MGALSRALRNLSYNITADCPGKGWLPATFRIVAPINNAGSYNINSVLAANL